VIITKILKTAKAKRGEGVSSADTNRAINTPLTHQGKWPLRQDKFARVFVLHTASITSRA
jgi:hypothetical protein